MNIRPTIIIILGGCMALWAMPRTAHGQFQSGDLYVSVNGTGANGSGSVYQYHPDGTQTPFAPGLHLDRPRGLAFDNTPPPDGPNLFVATNTRDPDFPDGSHDYGTIFKITPSGAKSTFATGFPSNFFLQGLVIDSAGNVFVAGSYTSAPNFTYPTTIYKIPPGGTVSPSPFGLQSVCNCSVEGDARQLAFDSAGTLYASDGAFNTIYTFTPEGGRNIFPQSFNQSGANWITFDILGNLFGSIENPPFDTTTGLILKLEPNGTVGQFGPGLANPRALAFDSAGNLFVTDIPAGTTGNIWEFTPAGVPYNPTPTGTPGVFASGIGVTGTGTGTSGPEYVAFVPGSNTLTPVGSNVTTNAGTVGFATIALTFPQVTSAGTTTVMPVNPSSAGYTLPGSSLAFDIATTAAYPTPVPSFPGIVIAFRVAPPLDVSQLTVLHYENGGLVNVTCPNPRPGRTPDTTTNTIYASVTSLSPFVLAKVPFKAQVQQPINADGTSVFSVKRGVVPVKFTVTQHGTATCTLPPATIALTRTSGGTTGAVDESVYIGSADTGSNFRIDSCQYIYKLSASALGVGVYRVDIKINGIVVGSGTFKLN